MSNFADFKQETSFKERIDQSQLWLMHANRTNQAAGNEMGLYDAYVRQQLRLLPQDMQAWVLEQDDVFVEEKQVLIYKTSSTGEQLGTEDNPLVWNNDRTDIGFSTDPGFSVRRLLGEIDWDDPNIEDRVNKGTEEDPIWEPVLIDESKPVKRFAGKIDWSDPRIYSPVMKIEPQVDYEKYNLLIMAAAERADLSWITEQTNSMRK